MNLRGRQTEERRGETTQSFELNCRLKTVGAVAALSSTKPASSCNSDYLFPLQFKLPFFVIDFAEPQILSWLTPPENIFSTREISYLEIVAICLRIFCNNSRENWTAIHLQLFS